jgi:hypothetical protein
VKIITSTFLLTLGLLIIGCSSKVEIPANKIGVSYDNRTMVVNDELLRAGQHSINTNTAVTLFDINEQEIKFSFDILFKDATSATLEFSIKYILKTDSLIGFCKKVGQPALEYPFESTITSLTKSEIRELMGMFDKGDISDEMIFHRIEETLKGNGATGDIIEILSFSRGQVKLD